MADTLAPETIANDLLQGAEAIARFLGLRASQVYHMARNNHPALKKEKGIGLTARKSFLRQHFGIQGPAN